MLDNGARRFGQYIEIFDVELRSRRRKWKGTAAPHMIDDGLSGSFSLVGEAFLLYQLERFPGDR